MKSKTFFFGIWCMVLSLTGCAQTRNTLKAQLKLLQNPSEYKFSIDSIGFSKIKNAQFFTEGGDTDVFDINSQNIHLVDFNNDGHKDIIYHEIRHYQATVLLAKKGDDFLEIWNGPGTLIDVKQGEGYKTNAS